MEQSTGAATAAIAMCVMVLARLSKNGLITNEQIKEDLDQALLILETMGLDEQELRTVHGVLDSVLGIVRGAGSPPKAP